MTHTPGPWFIIASGKNFGDGIISGPDSEGSRYRPLASAFMLDRTADRCSHLNIDEAERDANARLIATAPELLAALRKCEQRINQLCDTVNHFRPGKVRAEDFNDVARAAIAKAAR